MYAVLHFNNYKYSCVGSLAYPNYLGARFVCCVGSLLVLELNRLLTMHCDVVILKYSVTIFFKKRTVLYGKIEVVLKELKEFTYSRFAIPTHLPHPHYPQPQRTS